MVTVDIHNDRGVDNLASSLLEKERVRIWEKGGALRETGSILFINALRDYSLFCTFIIHLILSTRWDMCNLPATFVFLSDCSSVLENHFV